MLLLQFPLLGHQVAFLVIGVDPTLQYSRPSKEPPLLADVVDRVLFSMFATTVGSLTCTRIHVEQEYCC